MNHPRGKGPYEVAHRMGPNGEEFWHIREDSWQRIDTTDNDDDDDLIGPRPQFRISYDATWAEPTRRRNPNR